MIDKIHHIYEDSSEDLKNVFAVRSAVKYTRAALVQRALLQCVPVQCILVYLCTCAVYTCVLVYLCSVYLCSCVLLQPFWMVLYQGTLGPPNISSSILGSTC